jgi:hypothetical protein
MFSSLLRKRSRGDAASWGAEVDYESRSLAVISLIESIVTTRGSERWSVLTVIVAAVLVSGLHAMGLCVYPFHC